MAMRSSPSISPISHSAVTGGGVRVVGRRNPDREVFDWQLVFDQGTDVDDPRVRADSFVPPVEDEDED